MARVHDVDPRLIERTRRWLLAQRRPDGSWPTEAGMLDDGLAGSVNRGGPAGPGRHRLHRLGRVRPAARPSDQSAADARLPAGPLAGVDRRPVPAGRHGQRHRGHRPEPRQAGLVSGAARRNEADQRRRQAGLVGAGAGRLAPPSTATAAPAISRRPPWRPWPCWNAGQYSGTARGALTWLIDQKDASGTWHSTQATVLALKALLAGSQAPLGGDTERRIEVALGGEIVREFLIPADQADVMQQIQPLRRPPAGQHLPPHHLGPHRYRHRLPADLPLPSGSAPGGPARRTRTAVGQHHLRSEAAAGGRNRHRDGRRHQQHGPGGPDGDPRPADPRRVRRRTGRAGRAGRIAEDRPLPDHRPPGDRVSPRAGPGTNARTARIA